MTCGLLRQYMKEQGGRLAPAELAARIEGIHRAYHASLADELARIRAEWGAALLVDLFAAFGGAAAADGLSSASSPPPAAAFAGDGIDALCLGLEAWLRGEHARIDGLLRAQLRELSY